jgi:hypothetical protein
MTRTPAKKSSHVSKPCQYEQDPSSPVHYAWVDLEGGGGQWTPGEKVRIFSSLVGDEITIREFGVLVRLVDQIDGAAFLRREWVQLTVEDWSRMLGGVDSRTARRVKASLLEKELIIERPPDLIPEPEHDLVHGNVQAVRPQTPSERERRREIRQGSLHEPGATNGTATNGEASEEPTDQEDSTKTDENGRFSAPELPPWLGDDWTPPTDDS